MTGFKNIIFLSCCVLIFSTCRKDVAIKPSVLNEVLNPAVYVPPFSCEDTTLLWPTLPPNQPGINFDFANVFGKESVWRVIPDPKDIDVIFYLTSEIVGNNHHLWKYNLKTKQKSWLDKDLTGNVRINDKGWIVYDKYDWKIYKIKTNGDSLTQLTFNGNCLSPYWSFDEKFIYFGGFSGTTECQYKIDEKGNVLDTLFGNDIGIYYKDYMYRFATINNQTFVYQKNLGNNSEKIVLQSSTLSQGENVALFYPNEIHSNLYWEGGHGLSKTNLLSLQSNRLINGQKRFYHFRQSPITKNFYCIFFTLSAINNSTLKQTSEVYELSEDGKCRRKINLPD